MRGSEITEGPRDDIAAFGAEFNNPDINTRVQSQAARKNPAWKKNLVGLMKKHGFVLVGAGVNGAVFQNPKYPFVLKVYRTDQGYDEWLYFCRTHPQNPYVPKLRGATIRLNSIFSAVRIEPLVPCGAAEANDFIAPIEAAIDSYNDVLALTKRDPHLGEITKFMRDWQLVFDLTAHNVMQRADGTPVIIDPIYIEPGQELEW